MPKLRRGKYGLVFIDGIPCEPPRRRRKPKYSLRWLFILILAAAFACAYRYQANGLPSLMREAIERRLVMWELRRLRPDADRYRNERLQFTGQTSAMLGEYLIDDTWRSYYVQSDGPY